MSQLYVLQLVRIRMLQAYAMGPAPRRSSPARQFKLLLIAVHFERVCVCVRECVSMPIASDLNFG